jgi:hypothetical protein
MTKKRTLRLAIRLFMLLILTCGLIALQSRARAVLTDQCEECVGDYERCTRDVAGAYYSCRSSNTANSTSCNTYLLRNYLECVEGCTIFGDPNQVTTCQNNCYDAYARNLEGCYTNQINGSYACDDYRASASNWCESQRLDCLLTYCFTDEDGNLLDPNAEGGNK